MEMHPLKRVVLSLHVPALSMAHAALPGGLTLVCVVVFGLHTGSCVLPVFKEQSEAWILFILCPVLGVYLHLHPAVSLRKPSCLCWGLAARLTSFGATQGLPGGDCCFLSHFLSPVPEQGKHSIPSA